MRYEFRFGYENIAIGLIDFHSERLRQREDVLTSVMLGVFLEKEAGDEANSIDGGGEAPRTTSSDFDWTFAFRQCDLCRLLQLKHSNVIGRPYSEKEYFLLVWPN